MKQPSHVKVTLLAVFSGLVCAMDVTDYETFTALDKRLTKAFRKPELKHKDDVTEDLNYYILMMTQLAEELANNDHSSSNCTTLLYHYGKPNFLKTKVDETKLFHAFKWKKSDIKLFRFQIENCLKELLNFKKSYVEYRLSLMRRNSSR